MSRMSLAGDLRSLRAHLRPSARDRRTTGDRRATSLLEDTGASIAEQSIAEASIAEASIAEESIPEESEVEVAEGRPSPAETAQPETGGVNPGRSPQRRGVSCVRARAARLRGLLRLGSYPPSEASAAGVYPSDASPAGGSPADSVGSRGSTAPRSEPELVSGAASECAGLPEGIPKPPAVQAWQRAGSMVRVSTGLGVRVRARARARQTRALTLTLGLG